MYSCLSSVAVAPRQWLVCGTEIVELIHQVTTVVPYGGKVVQILKHREDNGYPILRLRVSRVGTNQRKVYNRERRTN